MRLLSFIFAIIACGCVHFGYTYSPERFAGYFPIPDGVIDRDQLFNIISSQKEYEKLQSSLLALYERKPIAVVGRSIQSFIHPVKFAGSSIENQTRVVFNSLSDFKEEELFYVDVFFNLKEGNIGNSKFYIFYNKDYRYIGYASHSIFNRSKPFSPTIISD